MYDFTIKIYPQLNFMHEMREILKSRPALWLVNRQGTFADTDND
jgi:hypothetical protein